MKRFYLLTKNKGFILVYTIIIISIVSSFIILSQLILNSKFSIYNNSFKSENNLKDFDFLDDILNQEFKNIEMYMRENKISRIEEFFDMTTDNNKIFMLSLFSQRISIAGYKIIDDIEGSNYPNTLKAKLKDNFKNNINIHFMKKIQIENEKYTISATINYNTNYSKAPKDLNNGKLKRIWIRKDD